jgi:3-methyladenine DNA glycosylase AlkD
MTQPNHTKPNHTKPNHTNAADLVNHIVAAVQALPDQQTATVRALRRDFSRQLAQAEPAYLLTVADRLLDRPEFVYRFVAYELVAYHRPTLRSLEPAEVERLGRGLDSWVSVDTFAPYVAGPAWRNGQLPDALIHSWARSPDRWWRRAALVCTVALNSKARGGTGDAPRTLAVCELLIADRDDMVVKAMSWALRELIPHDREALEAFVARHEKELAARVVREVRTKLTTGLKNPRRD